jgi:hypothetical protein
VAVIIKRKKVKEEKLTIDLYDTIHFMSHRFVATPHHPKVKYKKKKGLNKKMAYKFAWEFETQIIKK